MYDYNIMLINSFYYQSIATILHSNLGNFCYDFLKHEINIIY